MSLTEPSAGEPIREGVDIAAVIAKVLSSANLDRERIVLGVSGGPDSLALLAGVVPNRDTSRRDVIVAHFDHGLRAESGEDADFVQAVCRQYGVEFRLGRRTSAPVTQPDRRQSEATSRVERYGFFADVVAATESAAVLVGHTVQDQSETRLLHVIRGSGLIGLRGMTTDSQVTVRPGQAVRVLRPLLHCTHQDALAFCVARGLAPRIDRSNRDPSYARNRLRNAVIPELLRINPGVDLALDRLGRIAQDAEDFVESELERHLPTLVRGDDGRLEIDRRAWHELPRALKRALVRRILITDHGRRTVGADAVEAIMEWIDSAPPGESRTLPNARGVRMASDRVIVGVARGLPPVVSQQSIPLDGDSDIRWGPARVLDSRAGGTADVPGDALRRLRLRHRLGRCATRVGDPRHVDLDRSKLGTADRLLVRPWRAGDVVFPEGMRGRKKVQDVFVDAKIPREARGTIPILATPEGNILWISGLRRDRRFQADDTSTDVLCVDLVSSDAGET